MAKILFLLIVLVLVLTSVIIFRGTKESYELLPANVNAPLETKPFDGWKDFTSKKGQFKVQLPVLPQHATENIPDSNNQIRKYDMYVSEKNDGSIFMVSLITYPAGLDANSSEIMMDKVIQEMIESNPNNTLKEKKEIQFQNHQGRDFAIDNADVNINSREFVIGKTLYLLTYIAKKPFYNKDEYQHFIDSFELGEQPESSSEKPEKPPVEPAKK